MHNVAGSQYVKKMPLDPYAIMEYEQIHITDNCLRLEARFGFIIKLFVLVSQVENTDFIVFYWTQNNLSDQSQLKPGLLRL